MTNFSATAGKLKKVFDCYLIARDEEDAARRWVQTGGADHSEDSESPQRLPRWTPDCEGDASKCRRRSCENFSSKKKVLVRS